MALPSVVVVKADLRSNTDNSNSLHFLTVSYRNLRVSSSAVQSPAEMWGQADAKLRYHGLSHIKSKPLSYHLLF